MRTIIKNFQLDARKISGDADAQAIPLALAVGRRLLDGTGAIRVHGGGFAGTVQAYVPFEYLGVFTDGMEGVFGEGCCHVLRIRPEGACAVE